MNIYDILKIVLVLIGAPILGCLVAGIDRKLTSRLQGRVGPPLLQPYYDVRKLFQKDNMIVNPVSKFLRSHVRSLCSFEPLNVSL